MTDNNNTYTYNPEIDFKDHVYDKSIYDNFGPAIIYMLDFFMRVCEHSAEEIVKDWSNVNGFEEHFRAMIHNYFGDEQHVIDLINENEFNGEHVLFDDLKKLEESEFFYVFVGMIDYIAHMPNFPQLAAELNDKIKRENERYKRDNEKGIIMSKEEYDQLKRDIESGIFTQDEISERIKQIRQNGVKFLNSDV